MLLTADIGNTSLLCGIYEDAELVLQFRKSSAYRGSSDEMGTFLRSALRENAISPEKIQAISFCSVVPDRVHSFRNACLKYFQLEPFELGPGVKTGLQIRYSNPLEVGTDRIAGALAAVSLFPGKNIIVVDFGTATTLDAINKEKIYYGGAIFPGLETSMESLSLKTAKLPSVEILRREHVIGRSTSGSIQSGLYFGQLGMVKEITNQMTKELFKSDTPIILATGGFSRLFEPENIFHDVRTDLVLLGLRLAWELNHESKIN